MPSKRVSRVASSSARLALSAATFSAAYVRFCVLSAMALSQKPLSFASKVSSFSNLSIISWIMNLILAKGSAPPWIRFANAVRSVLLSFAPSPLSILLTASRPLIFTCGCTVRCWRRCRNPTGASSSLSAVASIASIASSLCATAPEAKAPKMSFGRPCCTRRIVTADVLVFTWSFRMPITVVSVKSSSPRTLLRWSQVLALSAQSVLSCIKYCWSSRSVEEVTLSSSLFSAMEATFAAFMAWEFSNSSFLAFIVSVLVCISIWNACTLATSSVSKETFVALKSFKSFSSVPMMSSEWNL
mmetsp:Transcript_121956/g.223574  ORF Transcript_121956/g.223574 Transcript_121956/m.223574 type:complete len:300 (-) Transcript_121956:7-906(-)